MSEFTVCIKNFPFKRVLNPSTIYYIIFIMTEIWVKLNNNANRGDTIVEISNTGLMKCKNGIIKPIPLRQATYYNGKLTLISRILAITFIPNPENKPQVDHITHNPENMNVNDIRNLRWCTNKENSNFPESIENKRKAKLGTTLTEEHKNNISKAVKGKDYLKYWQGKKMSNETKQKMSESAKRGWIKRKARKKAKD